MDYELTDTSWVKDFIHNVFGSNSKDADAIMAKKMQAINKPFYKYCYVCENSKRNQDTIDYNIENFEKDELFFQNPKLFNDPFDCFLGFSQTQLIKTLLVDTVRKQKKYTPEMRKAINTFFGDESTEVSLDEMDTTEIRIAMKTIIPLISESFSSNEKERLFIIEILDVLMLDENMPLFIKLMNNKLTVVDQQSIIDIMYSNEAFKEYMKASMKNAVNDDLFFDIIKRDMKLKVETTPDSFMGSGNADSFQFFDFFQMLLSAIQGKEQIPELSEIKKQFTEISNSAMQKSRQVISEQCRVTCLSERMDSPLMWSHYANKHYGFCLEYDFTHSIIKRYPDLNMAKIMLLPVIYSEKRPLLSKALTDSKVMFQYMKTKKMPNEFIESMVYGLLFKSLDWSYEKEWRIIGLNMEKPAMKLPVPRKLFLGANIEEPTRTRLIEIAKKKHIPVFQMMLSSDKYKFEYYKVD